MQVRRTTIVDLCTRFGGALKVPPSIGGVQLLWALAGNESSFGQNCNPRHEPGYCYGGRYFDKNLTALWGCLAHMSYGPWQVMYPNMSMGNVNPLDAAVKPDIVANAAVQFINARILLLQNATTIEEIAAAYNHGRWDDQNIHDAYAQKLVESYQVPLGSLA